MLTDRQDRNPRERSQQLDHGTHSVSGTPSTHAALNGPQSMCRADAYPSLLQDARAECDTRELGM